MREEHRNMRESVERRQNSDRRTGVDRRQNPNGTHYPERRVNPDRRLHSERRENSERRQSVERRQNPDRRQNLERREKPERRQNPDRRQTTIENRREIRARKKRKQRRQLITFFMLAVLIIAGIVGAFFYIRSLSDPLEDGAVYLLDKNYEEAILCFEEALEEEENIAEAYRGIGLANWELGNYEEAKKALLDSMSSGAKQTGTVYNMLAVLEMKNGAYQEAIEYMDVALDIEGNSEELTQELMWNKVVCYEKLLDWENAKLSIDEYIAVFPNDEDAQKEADFLATR